MMWLHPPQEEVDKALTSFPLSQGLASLPGALDASIRSLSTSVRRTQTQVNGDIETKIAEIYEDPARRQRYHLSPTRHHPSPRQC
jgi:hypothetical protein